MNHNTIPLSLWLVRFHKCAFWSETVLYCLYSSSSITSKFAHRRAFYPQDWAILPELDRTNHTHRYDATVLTSVSGYLHSLNWQIDSISTSLHQLHSFLQFIGINPYRLLDYGMYFVSKFNGLKFNAKDGDYRECNKSKVSILVHWIIVWVHYWILHRASLNFWDLVEFIFASLNCFLNCFANSLNCFATPLNCFATPLNFTILLHWI